MNSLNRSAVVLKRINNGKNAQVVFLLQDD